MVHTELDHWLCFYSKDKQRVKTLLTSEPSMSALRFEK